MMRLKIKGVIRRFRMPTFWIIINPLDLQNPLILILAGIKLPKDSLPVANVAIQLITATSNPVAVAQFFYYTYKAVFNSLLCSFTT